MFVGVLTLQNSGEERVDLKFCNTGTQTHPRSKQKILFLGKNNLRQKLHTREKRACGDKDGHAKGMP